MPNLTLEDVARQAGVSRSTVSRVVNGEPNVSDKVRKLVLEVIERTGYHPNAAARTLVSQRSWTIGLVLPHSVSFFFTDPYYPHLTKGIAQACNQHDYTLALFLVGTKDDEEKIYPRISRRGLLDGVILQSGHHGDQWLMAHLAKANVPVVVAGRPFQTQDVSFIDIDNVNAAFQAVNHLIRLGRRRIATIAGPANSAVGVDRLAGYRKALAERGAGVDEDLIVEGDFTEVSGYYSMKQLLTRQPDAIFAASDVMAIGAIRAIREVGLRVPEDISVVGFDDLPIATTSGIQLTTVRQHVVQFGAQAVELLLDLIENGIQPTRRVIMDTELIIRDSCGASPHKPKE